MKITVSAFYRRHVSIICFSICFTEISDLEFNRYCLNYSVKKDRRKWTDTNSIRDGCLALPPLGPPDSPGGGGSHVPEVRGSCLLTTNHINWSRPSHGCGPQAGRREKTGTTALLSPTTTHTHKCKEPVFSQTCVLRPNEVAWIKAKLPFDDTCSHAHFPFDIIMQM